MIKWIKEMIIKYREIISYLIVGGLTTVVSLGVYYACVFTFLNPDDPFQLQVANIISWIAAVTFAYFTNRRFVFESKNENMLKEAAAFFAARIGTLLMDMGIMFLFVTVFGFNDKIMKLVVQVVVTVANYIFSKFLVFNKKEGAEDKKEEQLQEE
ncbi:MAG: GtrA family protein [Eubacterium sp.]|nr:GtrA family protein [Eubacterium sp.]